MYRYRYRYIGIGIGIGDIGLRLGQEVCVRCEYAVEGVREKR